MHAELPSIRYRVSPRYTARHRHQLPGRGFTDWSEGVRNGRHTHAVADTEQFGFVADSVGSPVHRHAWNLRTRKRTEHGYTSGPLLAGASVPGVSWISRFLRR